MKKYFNQFSKRLLAYDLKIRDVEADGNCLFRAVADQLTGNEDDYQYYRSLTIKQLKRKKSFFKDFIPEDCTIETYTNRMSNDGIWGGHLELQALSDALQIEIVVHTIDNFFVIKYQESSKGCWQSICDKLGFKKRQRQIHLAYYKGKKIIKHYSSVRLIGDDTDAGAIQPKKWFRINDSNSELSTADETTNF